ncbi:hypothetical protein FB45DRAFT_1135775 [Roridomyces roridus]|uniref:Hydrophobin n=1 Tax=Roridomyces roridus TaxID=1738132 RepID=A0AAD7B0Y3_9AGAR|nr:hypothetical protein FB45DRAFT_1135775 [Roridomyces roridus]
MRSHSLLVLSTALAFNVHGAVLSTQPRGGGGLDARGSSSCTRKTFCCDSFISTAGVDIEKLLGGYNVGNEARGSQIGVGCAPATGSTCPNNNHQATCCDNILDLAGIAIDCTHSEYYPL